MVSDDNASSMSRKDTEPVCKDALQALTEMITSGELGPGSRLPAERQLAQLMGLSRNTVREAISALEMLRVLDVRRGDGIYVTSLEPEDPSRGNDIRCAATAGSFRCRDDAGKSHP